MTFMEHAAAHGLIIERLVADGQWHRVPTTDHKHKRNGAYAFNGTHGAIQNWATMQDVAVWKPENNSTVDRHAYREQNRKAAIQQQKRHDAARHEAARIIRECIRGTHPYLAAKGFPDAQGLIYDDDLIIPMREFQNYGIVNGVQKIAPDGTKLFLPGTKAKGAAFIIAKGALRERWLVEGFATGLSVQAALLDLRRQAEIIVTFSAGNLKYIAEMMKRPAYVFADNDASGVGVAAAVATGLPWVTPKDIGFDANDVIRQRGLRELVEIVRGIAE